MLKFKNGVNIFTYLAHKESSMYNKTLITLWKLQVYSSFCYGQYLYARAVEARFSCNNVSYVCFEWITCCSTYKMHWYKNVPFISLDQYNKSDLAIIKVKFIG